VAVKADVTVTFGISKVGLVLYPGSEYAGRVVVDDYVFPKEVYSICTPAVYTYDKEDMVRMPRRVSVSNKGTYGHVLVIAGTKGMSGAAYLTSMAAYRTGCGLVKIITHEDNRIILQSQLPEAIISTPKQ
jgi:NAD(P)H-hydrate epimerase